MNAQDSPGTTELLRRARRHIDAHRLPEAQTALESHVRLVPNDTAAWIELSDVMLAQGQMRASSRPLLQAATRLPRNAPLIIELTEHLVARGEIQAARACLDCLAQAPDPPRDVLVAHARLRFALGEIATAKALMDAAMAAGAGSPGDLHLHAMLLQFSGDIEGACAVLETCLQRWPQFGDAATTLVRLRRQTPEANRLAFVREQLRRLPQDSRDRDEKFVRAEFEYAQFKVLDDLQRTDEAWDALLRCNALMRELNPYDAAAEAAVVEALIDMAPAGVAREASAPPPGPLPIFIVGMARSGTTLLDRMLSSHSEVASAGEIIDFWRQMHWVADVPPNGARSQLEIIRRSRDIDFAEVGRRYLQQTRWRAEGRRYYIDKLPANIDMVAFIRRALPQAPVLHTVRDPMDTCFSNFKLLFGNISAYSYDLPALAHYYGQYARLVRHWKSRLPNAMLDVSYEALVRNPEATLRRVLDHCGLAMEESCLRPELNAAPVATPSNAQVRQSIHTEGIGQWRRYETQLQPLVSALAEHGCLER